MRLRIQKQIKSLLSKGEIESIDLVIHTFGLYSPKTLERISHTQAPWIEKRVDFRDDEASSEIISGDSIKNYYIENELNLEERIMDYIFKCMKG